MKVLGIAVDWNHNEYREKHGAIGAVSYYRLAKPLENVKQKWVGKEIVKMRGNKNNEVWYKELAQNYDMIITKHIDNPVAAASLAFMCQHYGTKLVVDLDDNLFEVKPDQPAWKMEYAPGGKRRAVAAAFIASADALIVSTYPLRKYYRRYLKEVMKMDKPIYVYPNYNDIKDFDFKPAKKDPNKVVIGWQGSTTHVADLKLVVPALEQILNKYPHVYLEFLGGIPKSDIKEIFGGMDDRLFDRIKITGGHPAWDKYPELLASMPWDIGIAPLVNDEFNRGKSHIKWMEYAMYKIPCVASRTYPYSKNIAPKTGYLAKNTEDWVFKLSKLIESKEKREEMGQKAYDYIKDTQQWEQHKEEYEEILNKIYAM